MPDERSRADWFWHRVTVENPTAIPDGYGGYTETWAPADPPIMRAAVEPASPRDLERASAGAIVTTATHRVTLDWHPAIGTSTRLVLDVGDGKPRHLLVNACRNLEERNRILVLICSEDVGSGSP